MSCFPFSRLGFTWVVPTLIGMIVSAVIYRGCPKFQPAEAGEEAAQS